MKDSFVRKVMRIICLSAVVAGALFAQGTRASVEGPAHDALLAEVRALRAEIHQLTSASIRTQLLVARLQLQEQRIYTVARQLTDAQNALASVQLKIAGERARVRQLEDQALRATGQGRMAIQQAILEAGTQIEQQQQRELQLRATENELLKAVDDAQIRWTDFSNRLDALERSLPAVVSH
jgi:hypothetical protein